jgi:hypothetical protein
MEASPRPPGAMRHDGKASAGLRSSPYSSPSGTPTHSRRPSHDWTGQAGSEGVIAAGKQRPPTAEMAAVATPDCAICASPISDPAVGGGCAHHFCYPCFKSWTDRKPSCPTCRAPVWSLVVDVEFAKMCGAEITSAAKLTTRSAASPDAGDENAEAEAQQGPAGCRTVAVEYPAGMTIGNSSKGGCLVVKVVKGNGAHRAGIRAGDVLLYVNGTEVRNHDIAMYAKRAP